MPVFISLLRGVNLGGHGKIRMEELRGLYEHLGLRNATTYIQSGNVIFRSAAADGARLPARIAAAIESELNVRTTVMLRTLPEWRAAIARNPFAGRDGIQPNKLAVTFLTAEPRPDAVQKALGLCTGPEELHILGREAYIYFPNGMGRPNLSWAAVERALGTPGTARNWNTVAKLLEIAEELIA